VELYLIRHGIAQERKPDFQDEERELTAEGREKTRKVAKRLHSLGLHFELILTSPLVRSRQTAEILRSCGLSSQIKEFSCLAPNGNIQTWLEWLEQRQMLSSADIQLAMVGHQPDLAQWASILVWGGCTDLLDVSKDSNTRPDRPPALVLKKAGIIGLKLPDTGSPVVGCSQLFWLTPPKFLL
jgi:phosphohistidine phosphatase